MRDFNQVDSVSPSASCGSDGYSLKFIGAQRLRCRRVVLACVQLHSRNGTVSTTMTIRLEDQVKERLDRLAESTQRSKSFLAAEAIREFVENNEWQISEIRGAIKEANAGDFATDKEVAALARKWKTNAG